MKTTQDQESPLQKFSSAFDAPEAIQRSASPPPPMAGGEGPIQRLQIGAADQRAYPKFKTFVENEMPKRSNDSRITSNLNTYGTNTGSTARDIEDDLSWGNGPTIDVKALSGANGSFSPGRGSTTLNINNGIVTPYENATTGEDAHELFLESTILHEYTHYLDDQDGTDRSGEEGQDFEEANYGTDIDSVSDARNVLRARYGPGSWTISVEGKEAGYEQRFIVSGATSGNGTYAGRMGISQAVSADPGVRWRIQIQHNDGSGWANSQMLNVEEGTDNYLLRSEDFTDSDNNDLELRVRK